MGSTGSNPPASSQLLREMKSRNIWGDEGGELGQAWAAGGEAAPAPATVRRRRSGAAVGDAAQGTSVAGGSMSTRHSAATDERGSCMTDHIEGWLVEERRGTGRYWAEGGRSLSGAELLLAVSSRQALRGSGSAPGDQPSGRGMEVFIAQAHGEDWRTVYQRRCAGGPVCARQSGVLAGYSRSRGAARRPRNAV